MGSTFLKAVYREYTDDTFTERKPQLHASDGLAGPTLMAEVGDLITVVFKVPLSIFVFCLQLYILLASAAGILPYLHVVIKSLLGGHVYSLFI